MELITDIILAAIIIISLIAGWRRGFVKSVMNLGVFILSALGAFLFYDLPSAYLYDRIFLPRTSTAIEQSILSGGKGETIDSLFTAMPEFFTEILNKYSTVGDATAFYQGGGAPDIKALADFLAAPAAGAVSDVIAFLLVFALLMIALFVLTFIIDRICRLPVLKGTNALLGLVLGGLGGLMIAWILAAILGALLPVLHTSYPDIIAEDMLDKTVLLKWLYQLNPLSLTEIFKTK